MKPATGDEWKFALFEDICTFDSIHEFLFLIRRVYAPDEVYKFEKNFITYGIKAKYITTELVKEVFHIKNCCNPFNNMKA